METDYNLESLFKEMDETVDLKSPLDLKKSTNVTRKKLNFSPKEQDFMNIKNNCLDCLEKIIYIEKLKDNYNHLNKTKQNLYKQLNELINQNITLKEKIQSLTQQLDQASNIHKNLHEKLSSLQSVINKIADEVGIHNIHKCSICFENDVECVFDPCGHYISCNTCCKKILEADSKCPICRKEIVNAIKTFL